MTLAESTFAALVDALGISMAPWAAQLSHARSVLVADSVDALRLARTQESADELVALVAAQLATLHGMRSRSSLRRWHAGAS